MSVRCRRYFTLAVC